MPSTGQSAERAATEGSSILHTGHQSAQKCRATARPGCCARHWSSVVVVPSARVMAASGAGPVGRSRVRQASTPATTSTASSSVPRCWRQPRRSDCQARKGRARIPVVGCINVFWLMVRSLSSRSQSSAQRFWL